MHSALFLFSSCFVLYFSSHNAVTNSSPLGLKRDVSWLFQVLQFTIQCLLLLGSLCPNDGLLLEQVCESGSTFTHKFAPILEMQGAPNASLSFLWFSQTLITWAFPGKIQQGVFMPSRSRRPRTTCIKNYFFYLSKVKNDSYPFDSESESNCTVLFNIYRGVI